MNTITTAQAAQFLTDRDNFLILTHVRPDGDTVGCAAGLCHALRALGKRAWVLPNEEATALFTPYLAGLEAPEGVQPAFVVSVDIAGLGLFPPNALPYRDRVDLAIDHHPSNEGFGRENCVDPSCAACGEIIYQIAQELGPVTAETALPLYVALATDTGCFVYGNTTAQTHRVAAALIETGIPFKAANKRHFRTKSFRRLQLEAQLMQGLERYQDGKLAIGAITLEGMTSIGATEEDADDIAAFLGQIEGVTVSVTIRELRHGECKLSVRTNGVTLDANRVCARLGGGGHAAASGCTVEGSVAEAKRAIRAAIEAVQAEG